MVLSLSLKISKENLKKKKKYGVMKDMNYNSNLTMKKILPSGKDKLRNEQRLLGS